MNELKVIKIEQIMKSDINYSKTEFLNTKAITMLKILDILTNNKKLLINPIEIIKQDLNSKYSLLNENIIYNISISTLIDICSFLKKYMIFDNEEIIKYFSQREV